MTYFLVGLFLVWRIFGIGNAINFVSKIFGGLSNSASGGGKLSESIRQKLATEGASVSPWEKDTSGGKYVAEKYVLPDHKKPEKTKKPKKPARKISSVRLIQNNRRSSEEILAGKPDFGWRRKY